jgi:predicted thioesterase
MPSNQIQEGLRLTLEKRVIAEDLAINVGTSNVSVLSTSALILFMEKAVTSLIKPYIEEGKEAVSSEINIKHFKPVGENELIRCVVHLKFVEKNKLFFDVAILDENHDEIAIGAHSRYIIDKVDFEKLIKE